MRRAHLILVLGTAAAACGGTTENGDGGAGGSGTETTSSTTGATKASSTATTSTTTNTSATTQASTDASGSTDASTATAQSSSTGIAGAHCANPEHCTDSSGYWCWETTIGAGEGLEACVNTGGMIEPGPCPENAAPGACVFDCADTGTEFAYIGGGQAECEGKGGTFVPL